MAPVSHGHTMTADLSAEQLRVAFQTIASWRLDPDAAAPCPACDQPGLTIIDRSTRPYTEWYALACPVCGLDKTVSMPMAGPLRGE